MNSPLRLSTLIVVINFVIRVDTDDMIADSKRYKIVSENDVARKFYPAIRSTKPDRKEENLIWFSKRKICEDVISSNYIGTRMGYFPYYQDSSWLGEVATRYADLLGVQMAEDNPSKLVKVSYNPVESGENVEEWVFVCPTRRKRRGRTIHEFHVSEEYKISGNSPSTDVAARFVFRPVAERIELEGMAEPVANALFYPDHDIEQIYLQRRKAHDLALDENSDPLCKLSFRDKIRVCTTVFNSEYFDQKESFNYPVDQINWVNGGCGKLTASFDREEGKAAALEKNYEEWFMSCRTGAQEDYNVSFNYLLSQAYTPNEIFVYSLRIDEEGKVLGIFLENLSTNIRFPIQS